MRYIYCLIISFCLCGLARAQDTAHSGAVNRVIPLPDTAKPITIKRQPANDTKAPLAADTTGRSKHDPRKATLRSLILPGWGQAYNREYWKIPIVYAAVGIPIGTYFYNNTWYKRTRDAYTIVVANDTANFGKINRNLIRTDGYPLDAASLQRYRNEFRRNRDYSILITLLAWGLNVVDATVFGHLKDFDVSDDLSLHVRPSFDPFTKVGGIGLVFNIKSRPQHVKQMAFLP